MILLVSTVSGGGYDKYKFQNLSFLRLLIIGLTIPFFAYILLIRNVVGVIIPVVPHHITRMVSLAL